MKRSKFQINQCRYFCFLLQPLTLASISVPYGNVCCSEMMASLKATAIRNIHWRLSKHKRVRFDNTFILRSFLCRRHFGSTVSFSRYLMMCHISYGSQSHRKYRNQSKECISLIWRFNRGINLGVGKLRFRVIN